MRRGYATRSAASVRQMFGMFLGTAEIPDFALAQNPYGAALSLARREQLGIDAVKLNRAFDNLTEADLRCAAQEIFSPARHAGAFISLRNKSCDLSDRCFGRWSIPTGNGWKKHLSRSERRPRSECVALDHDDFLSEGFFFFLRPLQALA